MVLVDPKIQFSTLQTFWNLFLYLYEFGDLLAY